MVHPPPANRVWSVGTLTYTTSGLVLLFFWLLFGDFAIQLKERSDTPTAQIVLKQLGAADLIVGLIIGSIPAAIGMIVGPIISMRSDRTRTRWGRRIPYLLLPLPVVVLAMVGLAFVPLAGELLHQTLGPRSPGAMVSSLIVFSFFWAVFETASAIINAIFGAYINDVVPQAVIGRFFGLFRMISLGAGVIYNTFIIGHADEHFEWIFLATGLFYGVGFTLMCLMVREGEYPPPAPLSEGAVTTPIAAIRTYFRECFTTPYYVLLFLGLVVSQIAFAPFNSFGIFFARQSGLELEDYGRYLSVSFVVSFVLAYFLGSLADRFHPLRTGIVCIAAYALVSFAGGFFVKDATTFAIAFVSHTIISGAYYTSTASIGQRLYPRLKFAQFASAAGLINALFYIVLPPTMGLVLDASGSRYHLTLFAGGILATLGFVILLVVHTQFMRFGGPKNYVPPLSEREDTPH